MSDIEMAALKRDFITGSHILHYHGVVDAYGHLSVRHPTKQGVFIMSRYIAPGTISSANDLIEYYIQDAEPVDPTSAKGYSERCIHSEILKAYPDVNAVVHSHAPEVTPYSISGVPFRAVFHLGGFLGTYTPLYDIAKYYTQEDRQDMLVSNTRLGAALAKYFQQGAPVSDQAPSSPKHCCVLMRGHGFTVCASSIQDAVMRAIYTQTNASIMTTALTTRAAYAASVPSEQIPPVHFLSDAETQDGAAMTVRTCYRPWMLWKREVEANSMYVNSA